MKYFITEEERKRIGGTCFFEFQKGQENREEKISFWKEDSLILDAEIMDEFKFGKLFPGFDYYGNTTVTREHWEVVKEKVKEKSQEVQDIFGELYTFAEENFKYFDYFLILGL